MSSLLPTARLGRSLFLAFATPSPSGKVPQSARKVAACTLPRQLPAKFSYLLFGNPTPKPVFLGHDNDVRLQHLLVIIVFAWRHHNDAPAVGPGKCCRYATTLFRSPCARSILAQPVAHTVVVPEYISCAYMALCLWMIPIQWSDMMCRANVSDPLSPSPPISTFTSVSACKKQKIKKKKLTFFRRHWLVVWSSVIGYLQMVRSGFAHSSWSTEYNDPAVRRQNTIKQRKKNCKIQVKSGRL